MGEGIEKERGCELYRAIVTVMFHGSADAFGIHDPAFACEDTAPLLTVRNFVFNALSQSVWVSASSQRRRDLNLSLSHTEKFSTEGPLARSALAVFVAKPNMCSPQAALTVSTQMTEQRCYAAA